MTEGTFNKALFLEERSLILSIGILNIAILSSNRILTYRQNTGTNDQRYVYKIVECRTETQSSVTGD